MSQAEFLRQFDADAAAAFLDAGMADTATYTPLQGDTVADVHVLVDRGVIRSGFDGQLVGNQVLVTAFLAEIGSTPRHGASFTVGADVYTVESVDAEDESMVRLLCKVGV